ncbi:hypothetical protein K438DRAFT_1967574 [Mycena galopus ATCC 62051]|nr:hypothetical protein K438DRAFT_1967574 [Mycena galopus ATCC 62051]
MSGARTPPALSSPYASYPCAVTPSAPMCPPSFDAGGVNTPALWVCPGSNAPPALLFPRVWYPLRSHSAASCTRAP